jgi:2'-5' RNA ligase
MSHPPITLCNDPKCALTEIANYLATVVDEPWRAVLDSERVFGRRREIVGYWQTSEWIEGLRQLAKEAQRVAERIK